MQSYGTERDRSYLLDIERRELNVHAVFLRATQLSQPVHVEIPVPSSMNMYLRQPWETPTDDTYTLTDSTDMKYLKLENGSEQAVNSSTSDALSRMETAYALAAITQGIASVEVDVEVEVEVEVEAKIADESDPSTGRNVVKSDVLTLTSSASSSSRSKERHRDVSLSIRPGSAHILEVAAAAADATMSDLNYLLRDTDEDERGERGGGYADDDDENYLEENIPLDSTGCATLKVIFDGPSRALCDFKVKLTPRNGIHSQHSQSQSEKGLNKSVGIEASSAVGNPVEASLVAVAQIQGGAVDRDLLESWIDDYLITSVCDTESILANGTLLKREESNSCGGDAASTADHCQTLSLPLSSSAPIVLDNVELTSVMDMEEEYSAYLGKKTVCPKVEDDVISRMIYIDRLSYSGTVDQISRLSSASFFH